MSKTVTRFQVIRGNGEATTVFATRMRLEDGDVVFLDDLGHPVRVVARRSWTDIIPEYKN